MIVDPVTSLGRESVVFLADFEGLSRRFAVLILRFKGVDFEGVFCSPRGVGATALEGVFLDAAPFVGVVCAELAREGVPGADPFVERLRPAELAARDRSRYE
jgi:hypothetical protein